MGLSTVETFKKIKKDSDKFIHLEGDLLRKYQMALLGIAEDIIAVCEDEGIVYHLSGGSCLGAIRHQGFIPWDDDMDLGILGEHFDRFVEKFTERFGDKYWVHTCRTPEYGMTIGRVRLKGSVCRGREDVEMEECGFFIDLFRMENTFDNPVGRMLHGVLCMGMGLLLSCRCFYKNRKLMLELAQDNPDVIKAFKFKISLGRLLSFMSVQKWARLTQWCHELSKNSKSKYVTIPSGRKHYFKEMYLREGMVETVKKEFEGHQWNVMKNYEDYLTKLYGDYMWIPPEEDRESHVLLELKFPEEMN